jgi:hypothetical protein
MLLSKVAVSRVVLAAAVGPVVSVIYLRLVPLKVMMAGLGQALLPQEEGEEHRLWAQTDHPLMVLMAAMVQRLQSQEPR